MSHLLQRSKEFGLHQFPVRLGFSFRNLSVEAFSPSLQNVLQRPGACLVPERFFNYSCIKYVKILVEADDSPIPTPEKGGKYHSTQVKYFFKG